jgi:cyclophilin family peptidyl-prolyl cis-trans isomerase
MTTAIVFLSVLFPVKGWFGPDQPWNVTVKPPTGATVRLVLTDFSGSALDPAPAEKVEFDKQSVADIKKLYPAMNLAGTYLLYAVPKGQDDISRFVGTPLVFTVREDHRRGAPSGPMVTRVEPLRYAIISTDAGDMTVAFYYGVAPNTVANFISLATERFYDDLTFHRVEPNFIIQGGDPRGDGTGGPGYNIDAEFSDRKQEKGVISMSRDVDPNESPNNPPRSEYANSGGSQFFISLDDTPERKSTAQLEGDYTVFGKVVGDDGIKTLDTLAVAKIADTKTARPLHPPVIKKIEVHPVTSRENPYRILLAPVKAEIQVEKPKDVAKAK